MRFVADRLELLGRRQQQLLDDQPGDLVDAGARLGRQPRQLRFEPQQLGLPDRLEALAQRDDRRDDLARLHPRSEPRALPRRRSPRRAPARRCAARGSPSRSPAGRRCCRGTPDRDPRQRLDVARHGDVDDEERPVAPRAHRLLDARPASAPARGAPVAVTTMSAAASAASSPVHGTRLAARAARRGPRPLASVRLAIVICWTLLRLQVDRRSAWPSRRRRGSGR